MPLEQILPAVPARRLARHRERSLKWRGLESAQDTAGLRPQIAVPGAAPRLQSKALALRLCLPGAAGPKPFCSLRSGAAASHRHRHPSALHVLVGWREVPEPTSPPASGCLPPQRDTGRSPREPRRGGTGCFKRGLLLAQTRWVLSPLVAHQRGTHHTTHQQHLQGGPGQAGESPAHQSAGSAGTNSPGSRLRADRACADVQQQLFSITKSSRIYQKTQGREGVLASGGAEVRSPRIPCSFMGQVRPARPHLPPF